MAFTASKIFRAYVADVLANTTAMAPQNGGDASIKVALYNNNITPAQDATAANTAYGAGAWVVTVDPQVVDVTNWVAGGRALASNAGRKIDSATANTVFFDADDLAGGGNVTIASAYGCLVYDDTIAAPVAKQGICYNYFGGPQSVTAGTFTLVWHANGIFRITL